MKCLKEKCIHHDVCALYTFSGYNSDECGFYETRPQGNWEYLKEHITELRDADGKLNQKQTCQFILNLMGVIEKEGEAE